MQDEERQASVVGVGECLGTRCAQQHLQQLGLTSCCSMVQHRHSSASLESKPTTELTLITHTGLKHDLPCEAPSLA